MKLRICRFDSECRRVADVLIIRERINPPPLFDIPMCWDHAVVVQSRLEKEPDDSHQR